MRDAIFNVKAIKVRHLGDTEGVRGNRASVFENLQKPTFPTKYRECLDHSSSCCYVAA